MRHVTFEVPAEVIGDFTEKLTEFELENAIVGKNEDGEILIEVLYDKSESEEIDALEEYLEELVDELEDEDED